MKLQIKKAVQTAKEEKAKVNEFRVNEFFNNCYNSKEEFAEYFNTLTESEQKHFAHALDSMRKGYPITNFLEESTDRSGKKVYYLRFSKGINANPVAKIVLDGPMYLFINQVHDGKIKVCFDMEDIKKEFGQDN